MGKDREIFVSRGTTPRLPCRIKDVDLSTYDTVWFTVIQNNQELFTKEKDDLIFGENNIFFVDFTQEETLAMSDGYLYLQIRARKGNGAAATYVKRIQVGPVLKEGVI